MKIVIDIPKERVQGYAMMYKTLTKKDDVPSNFDEIVERAMGTDEFYIDVFGLTDEATTLELGLVCMVLGKIGMEDDK